MSFNKSSSAMPPECVYVAPYSVILENLGVKAIAESASVTVAGSDMLQLIRLLLRSVAVSEAWYRQTYPDVDDAIQSGEYKSAKHHFVENGYFEGRRPGPMTVDEEWYLNTYPDVADGIENGEISSPQDHFQDHGYAEGRLPREY
jgi:hypothetical protein